MWTIPRGASHQRSPLRLTNTIPLNNSPVINPWFAVALGKYGSSRAICSSVASTGVAHPRSPQGAWNQIEPLKSMGPDPRRGGKVAACSSFATQTMSLPPLGSRTRVGPPAGRPTLASSPGRGTGRRLAPYLHDGAVFDFFVFDGATLKASRRRFVSVLAYRAGHMEAFQEPVGKSWLQWHLLRPCREHRLRRRE